MSYPGAYALCYAHLLRELTFIAEQTRQAWASELVGSLRATNRTVAQAQAAGQSALPPAARQGFESRNQALVATGLAKNPAPASTGKRGRPKQSPAKNLLDRLDTHRQVALAFLREFAVPFDNNLAERDLRMMKVQRKITGGFRTPVGASHFCRIRGFIVTLRKNGGHVLTALRDVSAGSPSPPAFST